MWPWCAPPPRAGLASVEMILILTTGKCWLRIMKDFDIKEQIILHRM